MLVRIQKDVPLTIFEEPNLAKQVGILFDGSKEKIKSRIDEIIEFLKSNDHHDLINYDSEAFSYQNLLPLFKGYFFKSTLNRAVEITFSEQGKYNILSTISSLLSEEVLQDAIMGEPMIDAFSNAIRNLPNDGYLSPALHGADVLLLRKHFLGKNIFWKAKLEITTDCFN